MHPSCGIGYPCASPVRVGLTKTVPLYSIPHGNNPASSRHAAPVNGMLQSPAVFGATLNPWIACHVKTA
jgi:hypothetical protein